MILPHHQVDAASLIVEIAEHVTNYRKVRKLHFDTASPSYLATTW